MQPEPTFSAPFNWCDRRCERCPLTATCSVRRHVAPSRRDGRTHELSAAETIAALKDTSASLQRSLEILREAARKLGVKLDAPSARPIGIDEVRLCRAGRKLMAALHAHVDARSSATREEPDEIMSVGMVIASKAARIGGYLHERRLDLWSVDLVPNLLLMERLRKRMDEVLVTAAEPRSPHLAAARNVLAEIDRIIAPLHESIAPQARALMDSLIAQRAAPSPFCTELGVAADGYQ